MTTQHAYENLFRTPWEIGVAVIAFGFGLACLLDYQLLGLTVHFSDWVAVPFFVLGIIRLRQGVKIWWFHRQLLVLKPYSLSTTDVPLSKKYWYVGQGFRWLPLHRQRLYLLTLLENQHFMQKNRLYRFVQMRARANEQGVCAKLTRMQYLPFKPMPDIDGKPWLHGIGSDKESATFIKQANRTNHECIFGNSGVGKTRYLSIKVNQDIRNGEAVLVLDPKGDLAMLQDIYSAAKVAGRLDDLHVVHFGFPDISAKYNPLSSFSNVSEVASRVTGGISGNDDNAFKQFAWKYVNIVATCLHEMNEVINYKTVSFYVTRPELLLVAYTEKIFPSLEPDYLSNVDAMAQKYNSREDNDGNLRPPVSRAFVIKKYLAQYIEQASMKGDNSALMDAIIVPLFNAVMLDQTYYDKITASLGPALDKINQTAARDIFSWEDSFGLPDIKLEDVVKRKQIVYIGMDSLVNKSMAEAVGQAIIADLMALCGRLYNEATDSSLPTSLCLHCDEFSNIVRDEFINLLNKARGAGVKISAYTQTVNDLGAAFNGNVNKPKQLLGNFGTLSMLRSTDEDTAAVLTRCLELVRTRSVLPSTLSNDKANNKSDELFSSTNTDSVSETPSALVEINDVYCLPKGQAFVMTNGGEVYKIRIPLPKNERLAPGSFDAILSEVNLCFS